MPKLYPLQSSHPYGVSFFSLCRGRCSTQALTWIGPQSERCFCSLTNLWPYLWLEWSKAGAVGSGRLSSVRDISGTRDQKKAADGKPPNGYPFGLEKQGVSWGWSYLKTNSQWFPKSDHAGHRSIRVFNECSQRRGSRAMGSDRWRASTAAGGALYSRMKALSCVSVDRPSPLKQSLCREWVYDT